MKIVTKLTITFLILQSFCSFAQQYIPVLKDNCKWNEFYKFEAAWNYSVTVSGDSLVNGTVYKKVYIDPSYYMLALNLLREDTVLKRIYRKDTWGSNETLLYDFNLSVGDTFEVEGINHILLSVTDSIPEYCITSDSVTCSINPRRVYKFTSPSIYYPVYWIEGLGSLAGLLYPGASWCGDNKILCHFDQNGTWDYYHKTYEVGPCDGYVSISNIENNLEIAIYPNPINNSEVYIYGNNISKATIIDAFGRTVREVPLVSIPINRIDFVSPDGVYFIKVYSYSGTVSTYKIIKIN